MITIKPFFFVVWLLLFSWAGEVCAQSYWRENNTRRTITQSKDYTYYTLDREAFERALHNPSARSSQSDIYIDLPDGSSVKTY